MILYYLIAIVLSVSCCESVTAEDSFSQLIDAIHDQSVTVDDNQNNDNLNIPVEVITDVSVDIVTTFTKIGDIEVNAEVHEVVPKEGQSSLPEIAVEPDLGDSALPDTNFGDNMDSDHNSDDTGVLDDFKYEDIDNSDRNMRPYQLLEDNGTQTNQTTPKETLPKEEEKPDDNTEAPKKSYSIWPIVLVAIIFLLFIVIGLIWAIITFCKTKRQEDEEEKQMGSETPPPTATSDASDTAMASPDSLNADVSPSPTDQESGTLRSVDSDKSADPAKSPSSQTPSSPTSLSVTPTPSDSLKK